ncbi:tRNA (adenosine(37)-N6)-threonylcarbamoyltransferase complex dimerization subunit type 1 TsaB, partial [Pseudomonas syringae pv. actinidiae]|nr:tRNA (adenosine(37)-N6)-threonylcarbamoyltransferase complex dimerization subunit type 1 TsaB [Pseudomonas syringae pv. actinidiae]
HGVPKLATLPVDASGQWFGRCGLGYAERIPVSLAGHDASMLPHAQDLLTLATFAWHRGEALPADDAQPVYLRDKVATPKAR